jgi:hypothetical protein
MLIVTTTEGETVNLAVIPSQRTSRQCKEVCETSDFEMGGGTSSRSRSSGPLLSPGSSLWLGWKTGVLMREM